MNEAEITLVVFTCVFGGAIAGMLLRAFLPEHHLSHESQDVVKLGMGLIATMSALVLSLTGRLNKDFVRRPARRTFSAFLKCGAVGSRSSALWPGSAARS